MNAFDAPAGAGRPTWRRWTAAAPEVGRLVEEFHAVETPAGAVAEAWLKHDALDAHPSVVTWVAELDGRLEGFYSLAGTRVQLTHRERRRLLTVREVPALAPVQPASLIAQHALAHEARISLRELLLHAIATALDVQRLQGNVLLVIEPFDAQTTEQLQRDYGFRRAYDGGRAARLLWLPLPNSSQID